MLSIPTSDSLATLLEILKGEVVEEFRDGAGRIRSQAVSSGSFHSSSYLLQIDRLSAEKMKAAGERALAIVLSVHRAEPAQDAVARGAQLTALLIHALDVIGEALQHQQKEWTKAVQGGSALLKGLTAAVGTTRAKSLAQLHLGLLPSTGVPGAMNTINVNAPVGSIQTGANSTAAVTQTIATPGTAELLRALAGIEDLLRQAGVPHRDEVGEVISDLRDQAERESPNPLKVSLLLGGLATLVQTVPQIEPFWATLLQWSSALRVGG